LAVVFAGSMSDSSASNPTATVAFLHERLCQGKRVASELNRRQERPRLGPVQFGPSTRV